MYLHEIEGVEHIYDSHGQTSLSLYKGRKSRRRIKTLHRLNDSVLVGVVSCVRVSPRNETAENGFGRVYNLPDVKRRGLVIVQSFQVHFCN